MASSKHSGVGRILEIYANSRLPSRVCITVSNSPNPPSAFLVDCSCRSGCWRIFTSWCRPRGCVQAQQPIRWKISEDCPVYKGVDIKISAVYDLLCSYSVVNWKEEDLFTFWQWFYWRYLSISTTASFFDTEIVFWKHTCAVTLVFVIIFTNYRIRLDLQEKDYVEKTKQQQKQPDKKTKQNKTKTKGE